MPKYRADTSNAKARRLIKPYIRNGLNQSALAREEGVSQSAINQRLSKAPVQKTLAEYLNKAFPKSYITNKFKEGLTAKRTILLNGKARKVLDLYCRHKYLVTLLEVEKIIRQNDNDHKGIGNVIIQIVRPA